MTHQTHSAAAAEQPHGLPASATDERFATLQARAALAGFELRTDPMGGYYVMRWGQLRMFDTLGDVEQWVRMVVGERRAAA